ncbi:MAG TPA: hypothetical protein VLS96_04120, partial [Nodosilinea sp.]|nr:hypothetical protein [Nodosilinea sp.]
MGKHAGERSEAKRRLEVARRAQGAVTALGKGFARRRSSTHLYLAMVGAALLVTGSPAASQAQSQAQSQAACADLSAAACCPGDLLTAYWPGRPAELNQTLCQLLVFPTAGIASGEDFFDRIVDGSVSSDSRQASAEAMTLPSLWWNRDSLTSHLGGRRLVQSWISYQIEDSATMVIDVVVNSQIWSVLTYNERYAVLNQFGTAARDEGYNLRFFQGNARNYRLVGLYACDFDSQPGLATVPLAAADTCSANLDTTRIVQLQRSLAVEEARRQPPSRPAPSVA